MAGEAVEILEAQDKIDTNKSGNFNEEMAVDAMSSAERSAEIVIRQQLFPLQLRLHTVAARSLRLAISFALHHCRTERPPAHYRTQPSHEQVWTGRLDLENARDQLAKRYRPAICDNDHRPSAWSWLRVLQSNFWKNMPTGKRGRTES
jgi:hypothetical protein